MQVFVAHSESAPVRPSSVLSGWASTSSSRRPASFGEILPSGCGQFAAVAGLAVRSQKRPASKASDQQSPKEEFHDIEFRILNEHLQELSKDDLERIAAQASIQLSHKLNKRQMIFRLLKPKYLEAVKKAVSPEERPLETISPDLLRKVQLHAARAANLRPKGAGRKPVATAGGQQHAEQASIASQSPLQICNVYEPLQQSEGRRSDEIQVGDQLNGRVVEISLLDGIRVDIGVTVDALVPVRMEDDVELLRGISLSYPLGSNVQVKIEDVSHDPERRFPIICSFQRQELDLPDWQTAGKTFRPHEAGIQSLRGRDDVELGQSDDWHEQTDELEGGTTKDSRALKDVPERPPPEVVMSIGSGKVEAIQVPEQHRGELVHSKAAVRKAWEKFTTEEVKILRLQLHCRQRLAQELATIEDQLLQGTAPSLPVELLGMTLMPDGLGCLLPVPDGDCLKFQVRKFDTAEQMHGWIESCHSHHQEQWSLERSQVEGEGPLEKEQLAKFFACADAWHARAVQAAEETEIRKLQYQNVTSDDSHEAMANLEDMISEMTQRSSKLKMQDKMKKEYLKGLASIAD